MEPSGLHTGFPESANSRSEASCPEPDSSPAVTSDSNLQHLQQLVDSVSEQHIPSCWFGSSERDRSRCVLSKHARARLRDAREKIDAWRERQIARLQSIFPNVEEEGLQETKKVRLT